MWTCYNWHVWYVFVWVYWMLLSWICEENSQVEMYVLWFKFYLSNEFLIYCVNEHDLDFI